MESAVTNSSSGASEYFGLACCASCRGKPCGDLRFGGVRPGKFILVHRSRFCPTSVECPFFEQNWRLAERELTKLSLEKLNATVSSLLGRLTVLDRHKCNVHHFVKGYDDFAGRIEFVRTLCRDGVISMIRVPHFYDLDPVLSRWLRAFESPPELRSALKKEVDDGPALTDALAAQNAVKSKEGKRTISLVLKVTNSEIPIPDDVFHLKEAGGKSFGSVKLKEAKIVGPGKFEAEFKDVPEDTKSFVLTITDEQGRDVGIDKKEIHLDDGTAK